MTPLTAWGVSITKLQLGQFHRHVITERREIILHPAPGKVNVVLGRYSDAFYGQFFLCRTVDYYVGQKEAVLLPKYYLVWRIAEYEPVFFFGCKCSLFKKQGVQRYGLLQGEFVFPEKRASARKICIQNIAERFAELARDLLDYEPAQTVFLFFPVIDDKAVAEDPGIVHDPVPYFPPVELQIVARLVAELGPESEAVGRSAERDEIILIFMEFIEVVVNEVADFFAPADHADFIRDLVKDVQHVLHFVDVVQELRVCGVKGVTPQYILSAFAARIMVEAGRAVQKIQI
jgi:hypothetical protein